MDQLPRLGKRELICLLLFTYKYVVSVWRGFLFLWVLGMGYVILLWHSLRLPYNYFMCAKLRSVRGSSNGTIGNFTYGTIGSQWCRWLTNGTYCTIGRANGTIGITIGTNGITNGTIGKTLNDIGIPLVPLGNAYKTGKLVRCIRSALIITGAYHSGSIEYAQKVILMILPCTLWLIK